MSNIMNRIPVSALAVIGAIAAPLLLDGAASAQDSGWIMITQRVHGNEANIKQCNEYALRYGGRGGDGQHLREGQWTSCLQRLVRESGGPGGMDTRAVRGNLQ